MQCSADCHMAGRHRVLVLSSGEVPASRHRSAHRATLGAPCLCMAPPRTHTQVTLLGGSVQWPDSHLWSILPYKEVINSHDWKEYGHQGHYGQQFPKHGAGGGVITCGVLEQRPAHTPEHRDLPMQYKNHGGGTGHPIISGCRSDQEGCHPSWSPRACPEENLPNDRVTFSPTLAGLLAPQALMPSPLL